MIFAERTTAFRVETLALQILLTHRAVETLAMVIIVQGLHPAISSFDWESTRETFRREQFVPISFAVGQSFFEKELTVAKQLATIGTFEAFRVEMFSNCVQAVAFDLVVASVARWGDETFEAVFAIELALLFYKADILKRSTTLGVYADEMIGAPNLSQSGDEWSPDVRVAIGAQGQS